MTHGYGNFRTARRLEEVWYCLFAHIFSKVVVDTYLVVQSGSRFSNRIQMFKLLH
jgi:hypothetical protein